MELERAARAARRWPRSRARCARSTSSASRCRRASTRSGSSRPTPRPRRERGGELPDGLRRGARSGARAIEAALSGPEHEPVPCHNDLLAANFIRGGEQICDRRLGVRGDGRPLLRPRQLRGQQRARRGGRGRRCSRPTSASRRRRARLAALRLMRFMSDFREAMWGVVQSGRLRARLRLRRLRRQALRPHARDGRATRASRPGSRRRVSPRAELPELGPLRDHRRRGRRRPRSPTTWPSSATATSSCSSAPSSPRARPSTPPASSASCAARSR